MLKTKKELSALSWRGKLGSRLQFVYHSNFSRVSIAILVAIAVLPLSGALIFIGCVGSRVIPGFVLLDVFSQLASGAGWWLLGNISLLFALVIGAAWSRSTIGGALASLWVFVLANYFTGVIFGVSSEMLSVSSVIVMSSPHMIQTPLHFVSVLGFPALDMGIIIGIVSGALGAFSCNSYRKFSFRNGTPLTPFVFFKGVLFIVIVGSIFAILTGAIFAVLFPFLQYLIYVLNDIVLTYTADTPYALSFTYGAVSRLLSPLGLYHIDTIQISYTYLSGVYTVSTGSGAGDVLRNQADIWVAWLNDLGNFRDPSSEFFSPDKYALTYEATHLARYSTAPTMLNNFALAAAILAVYRSINANVRSSYRLIFIGGFFTILFTGYISSVGFLLVFLSPVLYVVYILFSGVASVLMDIFHVHIHSSSLVTIMREFPEIAHAGLGDNLVRLMVVGVLYGTFVYYTFRLLISRLKVNAPGRGFNTVLSTLNLKAPTTCSMETDSGRFFDIKNAQLHGETPASWQYSLTPNNITERVSIAQLTEALGGKTNIRSLQIFHSGIIATVTNTKYIAPVNQWKLHLGAIGIIAKNNVVRIIYPPNNMHNIENIIAEYNT